VNVLTATVRILFVGAAMASLVALTRGAQRESSPAEAAAPPCDNYYSDLTPPENIGVAITNSNGDIVGVSYVPFKTYVKDVLPNEWAKADWGISAYEAGALAVKGSVKGYGRKPLDKERDRDYTLRSAFPPVASRAI